MPVGRGHPQEGGGGQSPRQMMWTDEHCTCTCAHR